MTEALTADAACILIFLFLEELFNFWRQILLYHLKFKDETGSSVTIPQNQTKFYYAATISWTLWTVITGYFAFSFINHLEHYLIVPLTNQLWLQALVYLLLFILLTFAITFLIFYSRNQLFVATKNSKINRGEFLLKLMSFVFYPLIALIIKFQKEQNTRQKESDEKIDFVSEDEIITLTETAVKQGALDEFDLIYMKRAFEFNDKIATDIMVDRTSMVVIDVTCTVKEALITYLKEGYSRYPVVADNNKDKILGYVYVYDLVRQAQVDAEITVSRLLRSLITVPETTPVHNLLQEMIAKHTPIVIAVDEYGGTSGIITDKDLYEELFGTVRDEIDDVSDEYIQKNDDQTFFVSGKTTLYDFERFFRVEIQSFEDSESTTVAGYISEINPDLAVNDSLVIDQFQFTVKEIQRGFINWFIVKVLDTPQKVETPETQPELTDSNKSQN